MDNFQLYRTNLYLGGQMKWDLVVDSTSTELYVSDFHLTPISNNIPYTYKSDENLLKNKHQDNVKAYYKNIEGYFYNEGLDSEFCHNYPVICNENEVINSYSNIYDMGCKRMKRYELYKKQFEFLCPVWIEHLYDDIKFVLSIKDSTTQIKLASNALILSLNNISKHNEFVKYFKSYVKDAGLITGSDNLVNISFNNYSCAVTGLNAKNGLFMTKQSEKFVNDITLRERPLMETDNMIIELYKNNSMICNQLFNFNICFNINDIISNSIVNMIVGEDVVISVDVYIGDKLLEKRDFYTNYEFIAKDLYEDLVSNEESNKSFNVFDYLNDNLCLELVDKNKFCQKICHWSLCNNNNYIFNVYNGFSGITIFDGVEYSNDHNYGLSPNTIIDKDDVSQNSTGWIARSNIKYWKDFYKFIKSPEKYKKYTTHIDGSEYINNIRYTNVHPLKNSDFYIIGMNMSTKLLASVISIFNEDIVQLDNDNLYMLTRDDLIILVTSDSNTLSFGYIHRLLSDKKLNDFEEYIDNKAYDFICSIYALMSNKIDTELVTFGGSIKFGAANGPSEKIKEITYYKDNNSTEYIFRYDGKIKPTFVSEPLNILYYKDFLSDNRTEQKSKLQLSNYINYINSGYEPVYPSIDYCAIRKIDDWTYDKLPDITVSEFDDSIKVHNDPEYAWFNSSVALILSPEINIVYHNKKQSDGTYKKLDDIIIEVLMKYYQLSENDTAIAKYITSKYNITNNWEYYSETNVDDYNYSLTFRLK